MGVPPCTPVHPQPPPHTQLISRGPGSETKVQLLGFQDDPVGQPWASWTLSLSSPRVSTDVQLRAQIRLEVSSEC